jgi:ABC-type iron transport system FetAB ATPase subunit
LTRYFVDHLLILDTAVWRPGDNLNVTSALHGGFFIRLQNTPAYLLILGELCNRLDDLNYQRVSHLIEPMRESQTTLVIYVNHHTDVKI